MSMEDAEDRGAGISGNSAFALLPEQPPRLRYYCVQLFLVSLATIVWNEFVENVTGWSELRGSPMGNDWFQVIKGIELGALGLVLGFLVHRNSPKARATGRWIWVLPLSFLLLGILWDLYAVSVPYIFEDYFYWSHPGRNEGPLLRDLLTYPAWSSIWYSVGIVIAGWQMRKRAQASTRQSA